MDEVHRPDLCVLERAGINILYHGQYPITEIVKCYEDCAFSCSCCFHKRLVGANFLSKATCSGIQINDGKHVFQNYGIELRYYLSIFLESVWQQHSYWGC